MSRMPSVRRFPSSTVRCSAEPRQDFTVAGKNRKPYILSALPAVMKFSVTKEKLLEGLQQVQNVVSTRTTLPILSNVLLQANEKEVHLTTTDLDVGVRVSFEAEVEKKGATTLT